MTILDSSILIAYISKQDSQHAQAVKLFKGLKPPVAIPEYIIVEVCTVLAFKVDKPTAIFFLEFVIGNKDFVLLPSGLQFLIDVVHLFKTSAPPALSFPDTSLLYLSEHNEVITFDKQLARAIQKYKDK